MSILPIDVQVNTAQTVEVSRAQQAQTDAPAHLQTALSEHAVKEADRDRDRVQETPEDRESQAASEDGTGRGRAFLRQQGERREVTEEEAGPQEPGKGTILDLKG